MQGRDKRYLILLPTHHFQDVLIPMSSIHYIDSGYPIDVPLSVDVIQIDTLCSFNNDGVVAKRLHLPQVQDNVLQHLLRYRIFFHLLSSKLPVSRQGMYEGVDIRGRGRGHLSCDCVTESFQPNLVRKFAAGRRSS